jgi:hypothetical protein
VERLAGEREVLGENPPHRRFVHHKSHMTWSGIDLRIQGGKPKFNRLEPWYGLMYSYCVE